MTSSNEVVARLTQMIDEGRLTAETVPGDFDWLQKAVNDRRDDVLLDCELRDWRCSESVDMNPAHKTDFRLVIEGSEGTNQVWFKIYPKVIDKLSSETPLAGLAGVIEVRNGQPAISLGVDNSENCLHVESDGKQKLFVHTSHETPLTPAIKWMDTHGMDFIGVEVEGANEEWFDRAREELANQIMEEHMLSKKISRQAEWERHGDSWSKCVCLEHSPDGKERWMLYTVGFVEGTLSIAKCDAVPVSMPNNRDKKVATTN